MTDLKDTRRCPRGHRCESCGTETRPLKLKAVRSGYGMFCLTLCGVCASFDGRIPVSSATAERLVIQHCHHLGINVDQMAAALKELP